MLMRLESIKCNIIFAVLMCLITIMVSSTIFANEITVEEQVLFDARHKRREQIADHQAPDKRGQNLHQSGEGIADDRDLAHGKIEQKCCSNDAESGYSPV